MIKPNRDWIERAQEANARAGRGEIRPRQQWTDEGTSYEKNVVWWSRLDDRYQIEVWRDTESPYQAQLLIFDHSKSDELIHEEETTLAYEARFGPDVEDVMRWQGRVLQIVDQS